VRCWHSDEKNPPGASCAYPSTEIGGVRGATDLAFGGYVCALTPGGVLCFGNGLGIEKTAKPIRLPTGTALLAGLPMCALQASGQIRCGEGNAAGQLLERTLSQGSKVELSGRYGCAILPDARQVCWGKDVAGAFGEKNALLAPEPLLEHVVAQGLAFAGNCAVTSDGLVYCRGRVLPSAQRLRPGPADTHMLTKVIIY
jgi:hypothetical protein